MERLEKTIDNINETVGKYVSWLNLMLVLLICVDVTLRYFFKFSKPWIIELEWHLFALIFLLGAAYTLKADKHVRVDVFYAKYSKKKKAWINLIGTAVFLIPWCLIIIHSGFNYGMNSLSYYEGSPNPDGLPARYIIKFAISIGFSLLLLQGISYIIKSIRIIKES